MKLLSRRTLIIAIALFAGIWFTAWQSVQSKSKPNGDRVGRIDSPLITEASGLACSRRAPEILWTHNDSGGQPVLYAVDTDAHYRGSVRIAGVPNRDWEDIDSFVLDGRAYLLIGDVGDNNANRHDCVIHIVEEPDPSLLSPNRELTAQVAWSLPVKYPKGARDCEAVAIDVKEEKIYLLTKRFRPPELFVLPLRLPADGKVPPAQLIARVPHIPQPTGWDKLFPVPTGRYRGEPTGMCFSSDGTKAAVLTYGNVLLYTRHSPQSWAAALGAMPEILAAHGLIQAEGICFSQDGTSLFVTGEERNPPLVRYRLPSPMKVR